MWHWLFSLSLSLFRVRVNTSDCGEKISSWLSEFLGRPCHLIKQSSNFQRNAKKHGKGTTFQIGYRGQELRLTLAYIKISLWSRITGQSVCSCGVISLRQKGAVVTPGHQDPRVVSRGTLRGRGGLPASHLASGQVLCFSHACLEAQFHIDK